MRRRPEKDQSCDRRGFRVLHVIILSQLAITIAGCTRRISRTGGGSPGSSQETANIPIKLRGLARDAFGQLTGGIRFPVLRQKLGIAADRLQERRNSWNNSEELSWFVF